MKDDVAEIADTIFGPGGAEDRELRRQAKSVSFGFRKYGESDTIVVDDHDSKPLTQEQREKLQRVFDKMMRGPQPRGMAMSSFISMSQRERLYDIVDQYYRKYPHLRHYRRLDGRYEQRRVEISITSLVAQLALM